MGGMHFGNVETSQQLKATLEILQQGGVKSTATISRVTKSMAVHSDIAALRKNGLDIKTCYLGKIKGRKRFGYELLKEAS